MLAALAMLLLAAAGPASALDQPLEGIPLPRAVTKFEHQLGVSDNSLPGGKHSVDKGQFALSSYDQSILAGGPPVTGDGTAQTYASGPVPGIASAPAPAPAPAPSYSYAQPAYAPAPAYSYAQPAYAQLTYAYPQYQQQQGYTAYQSYQPMATNGYQYPKQQYTYPQYAQQGQYAYPQQQQYQQPQQQQTGATGSNYWDYSQANGALAGANGDIASAAAFTDKTNSNQYANLGWHPTLERMMGVHKSKRNKGPRLALKGQLAGMKGLQKPHLSISPSVDPQQVSVAAQKLEKAQALLRISVSKGLKLKSGRDSKIALGQNEDPCSTLACERARTDGGRHAMTQVKGQTLQTSLAKHPVGGPDANNPLFHDVKPKPPLPPHPPPPHLTQQQQQQQERASAHDKFEERFKELSKTGDSSPPSPHALHARAGGGGHRDAAALRARRRLQHMHAAAAAHSATPRRHGRVGGGGQRDAARGDTSSGGGEQKVLDAHERLAAKARHGQGLAAMAHENHHAFHFPAYMVKNTGDPAAGQEALMGPNGEPRMKKIGPESSVAMGILISIFIGLLGAAVLLGWMHARKERKRNEMVALSGFVDDNE